ncbi:MAG: hypothetical protein R6U66_13215 [Bacteroidales bacterium]
MEFELLHFLDFLTYGALGIALALAILAYRLLSKEQDREAIRPPILRAIKGYLVFALLLSVFFGTTDYFTTPETSNYSNQQIENLWQQHFSSHKDTTMDQKVQRLYNALATHNTRISLESENRRLHQQLARCSKELSELNKGFYPNITKLRKAIDRDPDGWINTTFKPEEKKELYNLLDQIFISLGEYNTYANSNKQVITRWKKIKTRWSDRDTHYIFRSDIAELVRIYINRFHPLE